VRTPRPVAFLAGATGGIGPAIARRLARDGFDLALATRRRPAEARALAIDVATSGARAIVVAGDLGREPAARRALEKTHRVFGRLDALVLAVGDLHLGKTSETTARDLRAQFATNVELPWTLARAALPRLRRSPRARVVFFVMSGVSALTGKRQVAAHAAAKTALLVMARSLALEVARDGIVVTAVAPGVVRTSRSRRAAVQPFLKAVPGGRAVTPDEVAAAVSACLSVDAATWSGAEVPAALGFGL